MTGLTRYRCLPFLSVSLSRALSVSHSLLLARDSAFFPFPHSLSPNSFLCSVVVFTSYTLLFSTFFFFGDMKYSGSFWCRFFVFSNLLTAFNIYDVLVLSLSFSLSHSLSLFILHYTQHTRTHTRTRTHALVLENDNSHSLLYTLPHKFYK